MRSKRLYIPIGALILVVCAVGFLSLRSDIPTEPIKIYKVTTPDTPAKVTETTETETAPSETATGGHFHEDGTWHAEPHTEETAAEKIARSQQEIAHSQQQIAKYKAETAKYKAETAAIRAEFEALKAKDAERTKHLSRITEKGKEIIDAFPDVLVMTPDAYLALSETEQEEFLLQCVEYDLAIGELQDITSRIPQWIIDEWNEKKPGAVDEFLNLPLLTELYGSL